MRTNKLFILTFIFLGSFVRLSVAQEANYKTQICKKWVLETSGRKDHVDTYKIDDGIRDTAYTITVYLFKADGNVEESTYYSAATLRWLRQKPCGNGDPYIISSKWFIKDNCLYWNIQTGLIATPVANETDYKYKIVSLTDKKLALTLLNSKTKNLR